MKKEKKKLNLSQKQMISLGVWLIIIGIIILGSNYFQSKKYEVYEEITFTLSNIPLEVESETGVEVPDEEITDTEITTDTNTGQTTETFVNKNYYIGRIEIPEISLVKGFASKESQQNNVNKNVAIITPSDYPDVEKGNFILAAHTGSSWNSYFKNLYKLNVNSVAYIYYNNVKYTYTMVNKYDQEKTGQVRIYRDTSKTTLTLVTCKKGTKDLQTVFIYELTNKEEI